ncbi:MAG: hypothetical protein M3O35_20750 [Acidobacteriota bacterium]|nr:hypothetical protein [Acidobacteriota bacterium]
MTVFFNRGKRIMVVAMLTFVSTKITVGQVGTPKSSTNQNQPHISSQNSGATPASPEALAASLWQKMTTTCQVNVQGQMKTMTFIYYPAHHPFKVGNVTEEFVEYSGAWTKFVPLRLTEADRLNGIQFQGMAILGGTAWRQSDSLQKEWSEWRDLRDVKLPKWLGGEGDSASFDSGSDAFEMVKIEKRNNQWSLKLPFSEGSVDPDFFAARKKSCALLTRASPGAK